MDPNPEPTPTPEPEEPEKKPVIITHYVCNDNPDCGYDTTDREVLVQHMFEAHGGPSGYGTWYEEVWM